MHIDEIPEQKIQEQDNMSFDNKEIKPPKPAKKTYFNKKMFLAAGALIVLLIAGFIIIKKVFAPKPAMHFGRMLQTKPIIDNAPPALLLTDKSGPKPKTIVPAGKPKDISKKDISKEPVNVQKQIAKHNEPVLKVPALPIAHIKNMLKFNSEIGRLKEQVKIAQLESQIKTLKNTAVPGGAAAQNSNSITLIALTKNTALISFGKAQVTMKVGMSYGGYRCLMIAPDSVTLERGGRTINLSLSM